MEQYAENEQSEYDDSESGEAVETEDGEFNLIDYFMFNGNQFYPKSNIVDMLSDSQLQEIGRRVVDGYNDDIDSMSKWSDGVQKGLDLLVQETAPRSTPWQGACNYKSPTLGNAGLQFSDRMTTELMRQRDLVMVNVVGKDKDDVKQKKADRISVYENYQINVKMAEWRDEHEKMLYLLPSHGTVFKKIYYDPSLGRNVCDLVTYPNFALDNTCTSINRLRRFSEPFTRSKNEIQERLNSGVWVDTGITYGDSDEDIKNPNAEEPSNSSQDQNTDFIEQQCWYDCDDDGYEEPYTVVVQTLTQKVVRVTPRYELSGISVKVGSKVTTADKTQGSYDSVVRIEPNTNLVMYGMLHDPQGGLLYEGYGHILAALTQAINTTTNQLVDAGTFANMPAYWLAKGFRAKLGDIGFAPGECKSTGLSAAEMQQGIMPHPTKEPSAILYQLRNDLIAASNEYSASADLSKALSPNAPAATTLALIQEKQLSSAAIILRVYRTMAAEFKILFDLDSKFIDMDEYVSVVDDEQASLSDFNAKDLDIVPSANPEISSRMMRIQQANAEIMNIELVAQAGGDIRPIIEGYYEAIGCSFIGEIFSELSPEQQLEELLKRNPQLNDLIMQAQQQTQMLTMQQAEGVRAQNAVLLAQADKLMAEAEKTKEEAKVLPFRAAVDMDKVDADTKKAKASAMLDLEKAESESVNNNIDKYTHAMNLDSIGDGVGAGINQDKPVKRRVRNKTTGTEHDAELVNGEWKIT